MHFGDSDGSWLGGGLRALFAEVPAAADSSGDEVPRTTVRTHWHAILRLFVVR